MGDYDSDDEKSQYQKILESSHNVKTGMFVSGWDDDDDIEEERNPHETLEKEILWAVNENKLSIIHQILQLDPECVSATDEDQYTPLHRACYNNFTDIATLLLKYRANPNAQTEMKWTPLHSACKWGNAQCVALLLQNGADVNVKSEGLQTPLHITSTVSNCRNTATVLLMDHNIDANVLNNSDETAMHIANRSGMSYLIFEMGHDAYKCETGFLD